MSYSYRIQLVGKGLSSQVVNIKMSSYTYLILLSVLLLNLPHFQAYENKILNKEDDDLKLISFTDAFSDKFSTKGFTGTWTSRTEFTYLANDGLREFNLETRAESLLLDKETLVRSLVN